MAAHMKTTRRKRSFLSKYWSHIFAFFAGCICTSLLMTLFLHQDHFATAPKAHKIATNFAKKHLQHRGHHLGDHHGVGGLDCSAHGGPSKEEAQEMVYWRDIKDDANYVSPFHDTSTRRYLTFEPDGGGWNNIRMAMETVLTLAIATGRVLVLPPSQRMYLLGSSHFSFADFFPLHDIANEHSGLEILTTKQFLEETYGKVYNRDTKEITYPPSNKTEWDGDTAGVNKQLGPWLRQIAYNADWKPDDCLAAFPGSKNPSDEQSLRSSFDKLKGTINFEQFMNKPTPVNASSNERLAEFLATRSEMCLYDKDIQNEQIIHFAGKAKLAGGRLLVHFYAFLFFADWKEDLWMKRFVRDHVRYIDDIQCAAARIVAAVRDHSRKKSGNQDGYFDSFHIRRGDFQYKKTRVDAADILKVAKDQIPKGSVVYVATDERQKEFFKDMEDYWDVLYMDNFMHLLEGVDKNYFGMIDQLVSSRGRKFFGCWFSTFTGYIARLRGYDSQNMRAEGYEMGLLPDTFYYALEAHKTKMHEYWPVKKLFYAREYPVSWRNIDFNVPES